MGVSAQAVKELREMTGAGILACKQALEEANGDMQKAMEILRKRYKAIATKKASREAKEGRVAAYVHGDGRIGVLVEVNCETDFVAMSDVFKQFVNDVCLQIAGNAPLAISREDLPKSLVEQQREVFAAEVAELDKPEEVKARIIEGKLEKWYQEVCLLEQKFFKDETKTMKDLLEEAIGKTGENIKIRRFVRYERGEGL